MPAPADAVDYIGTTAEGRHIVRLHCSAETFSEKGSEGSPEAKWIHVVPFGPLVSARDGRTFQISDLHRLVASSELPMLLDWEHNSEKYDGSTRAAGWHLELAIEDGNKNRFPRPGVWARTEFTDEGAKDVAGKSFRYVSPVLLLAGEERDAVELLSVALTNRPALRLAEINEFRTQFAARFGSLNSEGESMEPKKRKLLLAALALAEAATDDQIVEAVTALNAKATDTTTKELCASVTTQLGTSQAEVARLTAELAAATKTAETATFEVTRKAFFDKAVTEGKITPAARAGYEAMCPDAAKLAAFETTVYAHLPVIAPPAPKSKAGKSGDAESGTGGTETKETLSVGDLTTAEKQLHKQGYSLEQIKEGRAEIAAKRAAFKDGDEDEED